MSSAVIFTGSRVLSSMVVSYAVLKPALSPEGSIDYRPCRRPCRQECGASMSLDIGVLDHSAPNLGLFLDECRGLGGSAAGGAQVDLGKVLLRFGALQHLVYGFVELGDDGGRRLWRCGHGIPGAGFEILHTGLGE